MVFSNIGCVSCLSVWSTLSCKRSGKCEQCASKFIRSPPFPLALHYQCPRNSSSRLRFFGNSLRKCRYIYMNGEYYRCFPRSIAGRSFSVHNRYSWANIERHCGSSHHLTLQPWLGFSNWSYDCTHRHICKIICFFLVFVGSILHRLSWRAE